MTTKEKKKKCEIEIPFVCISLWVFTIAEHILSIKVESRFGFFRISVGNHCDVAAVTAWISNSESTNHAKTKTEKKILNHSRDSSKTRRLQRNEPRRSEMQ
jgi:hypothetical protein